MQRLSFVTVTLSCRTVGTFTIKRLDVSTLLATLPHKRTTADLVRSRRKRHVTKEETALSTPFPEQTVEKAATTWFSVRSLSASLLSVMPKTPWLQLQKLGEI